MILSSLEHLLRKEARRRRRALETLRRHLAEEEALIIELQGRMELLSTAWRAWATKVEEKDHWRFAPRSARQAMKEHVTDTTRPVLAEMRKTAARLKAARRRKLRDQALVGKAKRRMAEAMRRLYPVLD